MFRPNVRAKASKLQGTSVYGKREYSDWFSVDIGIVKLEKSSSKTSVRTDSSGSRGSAREILADARILLPSYTNLNTGDRLQIHGMLLTVESITPRYSVMGHFDHWQVDCSIYYEGEPA